MNSSILKAFNNHLSEFMNDLCVVFPNDLDIKVSKTTVSTLIKFNPSKIIKLWNLHICKYSNEIENGDIEYFLNKDYSDDLNNLNKNEVLDNASEIIDKFREPVRNMGKENQEKALKYIQNLNKLCKVYFNNN